MNMLLLPKETVWNLVSG